MLREQSGANSTYPDENKKMKQERRAKSTEKLKVALMGCCSHFIRKTNESMRFSLGLSCQSETGTFLDHICAIPVTIARGF